MNRSGRWYDTTCNFCDADALTAKSIMAFPLDRSGVSFHVTGASVIETGFAACPHHWQAYRNHTYEQLDALATVVEVARALES